MKQVDLTKLSGLDLGSYDYKLLIDRSYSMNNPGENGTRWEDAHEISKGVANVCDHYDDDGIDIILFDSQLVEINNVTAEKVDDVFNKYKPNGSTDTGKALRSALAMYTPTIKKGGFFKKDTVVPADITGKKPLIVIVLTDGAPNSQQAVESAIIEATQSITNRKQLGISFLQVGDDGSARRFLKSLDDDLEAKGAKFDVVDTKLYKEVLTITPEDILIGALTD